MSGLGGGGEGAIVGPLGGSSLTLWHCVNRRTRKVEIGQAAAQSARDIVFGLIRVAKDVRDTIFVDIIPGGIDQPSQPSQPSRISLKVV